MNIKSYLSILFVTLFSLLLITAKASGATWTTEVVDSSGDVGFDTSIALDTSDNVHISYSNTFNKDLKYATTDVPVPDIKANGSDEPITFGASETLSVSVSLAAGSSLGVNCDWWVVADTPYGWFYLVASTMSWEFAGTSYTDLLVTHQGALINLATVEVLNMSGLPEGTYIFYFGVDIVMNGTVDEPLFYDLVEVDINPDTCTDNNQCPSDSFCKKEPGDCNGIGVCSLKPEVCPLVWVPVCGCDGLTYGNSCDAFSAGVSVAYSGECL